MSHTIIRPASEMVTKFKVAEEKRVNDRKEAAHDVLHKQKEVIEKELTDKGMCYINTDKHRERSIAYEFPKMLATLRDMCVELGYIASIKEDPFSKKVTVLLELPRARAPGEAIPEDVLDPNEP
jgi:hypothetical protein